MILATTNEIFGKELETLGMVKGSTVQTVNAIRDIGAGLKTLVGGELTKYNEMMNDARALATKPKVVLADEPTANLDSKTGEDIIALMKKINKELKTTFIFSTHDHNIFSIADHVIRLKDGLVAEDFRQHAN